MTNVSEWSTAAGSNNDAPPDGWPEGMLPGKVNDSAREMMASLAKWFQDSNASLTTSGTTTAYTLTTNSAHGSLTDIPLLVFKVHAANTGACTLAVDGLGAKPLRKSGALEDYGAGELTIDQTLVVSYNSSTDAFEAVGPSRGAFPSGTVMVFAQTAAPTGWTKGATHDNKALRVVTGAASSGGTTAFTSVFTSRTIAQANLPSVNLTHTLTLPNHTHSDSFSVSLSNASNVVRNPGDQDNVQGGGSLDNFLQAGDEDDITATVNGSVGNPSSNPSISGTVPLGGSGTAVDFAVQYVDVILATKD